MFVFCKEMEENIALRDNVDTLIQKEYTIALLEKMRFTCPISGRPNVLVKTCSLLGSLNVLACWKVSRNDVRVRGMCGAYSW